MTETATAEETTATDPFPADADAGALAVRDDDDAGELELFPPARTPVSEARAMLAEHRAMLDDAYFTANVVCQTPLAPQRYRGKPKEGAVAIMYGAELGLPPMASLQKVINIHGMPSLEARTMKGLLKAKGFQFRTVVKAEDEFIIHAWEPTSDKRVDPPDEIAHWTMARAIKARYVPIPSSEDSLHRPDVDADWVTVTKTWEGKSKTSVIGNMKYITDPVTMLEAKGTADVCRAIAPEILMGLPYAAEERADFDDYDDEDDLSTRRTPPRRGGGVGKLRDRARSAAAEAAARDGDEPQDAEVVEDGGGQESTEGDNSEKPIPSDVTPDAPQDIPPSQPIVTSEEGVAGEDLPGPGSDLEMSAADRARGLSMMHGLLINGGIKTDEIDATWEAVSEIVGKWGGYRPIKTDTDLTNSDLKYVVDTLREWKSKGKLVDWLGEALNNAGLREAGMLENDGDA